MCMCTCLWHTSCDILFHSLSALLRPLSAQLQPFSALLRPLNVGVGQWSAAECTYGPPTIQLQPPGLVVSLPCVAFIASWEPNLKVLYSCLVTQAFHPHWLFASNEKRVTYDNSPSHHCSPLTLSHSEVYTNHHWLIILVHGGNVCLNLPNVQHW